jgi:hypothetical protein
MKEITPSQQKEEGFNMTDLLNQARNNSSGGGNKKMWTGEETVALIVFKSQGKTTKQIAQLVGHPENSVVYRFNRFCGKYDSMAALLDKIGIDQDADLEAIAEKFTAQATEQAS